MSLTKKSDCRLGSILLGALCCIAAGCANGDYGAGEGAVSASTISLAFPEEIGPLERPPVSFDHGKHATVLERDGCKTCHLWDEKGKQLTRFWKTADLQSPDALQEAYHDKCIGCHTERSAERKKTGPLTCGECHADRLMPVSTRSLVAFDYSLHQRHVTAMEKKCETCHHVYNKETQKLEYKKEAEDACRDCHLAVDDGKTLSLRNAAHRDCISCHLDRIEKKLKSGPVRCIGCHDGDVVDGYEKLPADKIERLKRKQPDKVWIAAPEAKSKAVAFNHQAHEAEAAFCTTCHHKTPKPCKECHTLTGKKEGDFVTMATSYHLSGSEHSCVGCHRKATDNKDCLGCHYAIAEGAGERSCAVCHSGPSGGPKPASPGVDGGVTEQGMLSALLDVKPEIDPLPAVSDDFPEKVEIKLLAKEYEPSEMPHRKVVAILDEKIRKSKLALRFHQKTETLCAGCHHHGQVGARPAPCRACHSDQADGKADKPGLRSAYHRQCMGCHQQMGLKKVLGCTDCHKKAAGEVSK